MNKFIISKRDTRTYLHSVPPLARPHLRIYAICAISVREYLARTIDDAIRMSRVTEKSSNGLYNVTKLDEMSLIWPILEGEPLFFPLCPCRNGIDFLEECPCVVVRQTQFLQNLKSWSTDVTF